MKITLNPRTGSILALAAGALAPLSLAPFDLWPLAIISLLLLLWVLDTATNKQAAWYGWLYGLGFYGVGASWVYHSIHEYGYAPVPLALFLTALFVAGLALLLSTSFAWLYVKFIARRPFGLLLGFPALWVLFEWLRSWLLTGFPWLYLGYGHTDTWLAGWAPVIGVYGISLIVTLSTSLLFHCLKKTKSQRPLTGWAPLLLLALPWLAALPLKTIDWTQAEGDSLRVTLLQPNISQHLKWRPEQRPKTLELLRQETGQHLDSDLVIWPENAVPLFVHQAEYYLNSLNRMGEQSNTAFISGIPYWQPKTSTSPRLLHNSIVAFGHDADGLYHKQKLVPFGEYVPLQSLLRGVIQFFDLPMSDFGPGPKNQQPLTLKRNGQKVVITPYICYEIVYPDFVRATAQQSNLLLTISDDSWFGTSIGPYQHLQMARMRALENSRYLVRGTNTGITAIVDHSGKVVRQAEQFQQTSLTGEVELMAGLTPFARWGSVPVLLLCGVLVLLVWFRKP